MKILKICHRILGPYFNSSADEEMAEIEMAEMALQEQGDGDFQNFELILDEELQVKNCRK